MSKAFAYSGVDVTLTDYHKFTFDGAPNDYETAQQVKDAIDRQQKEKRSVEKRKMSLAVITEGGKTTSITGIHAGTFKFLFSVKLKEGRWDSQPDIYPDCPKTRELIASLAALRKQIDPLKEKLYSLKITEGGKWNDSRPLQQRYDDLEKRYAELLKDAGGQQ